MKLYVIDFERSKSARFNSLSKNGRSITDPFSLSPRIKPKNVEWVRMGDDVPNFKEGFNIPDDVNTVIWSDRAPLFYMGFNGTIWTYAEHIKYEFLYDFKKPFPNKRNIHMIFEPIDGCGEPYFFNKKVPELFDKFDIILTHNRELTEFHPKIKWYPWGTSLLDSEEEFQIYPKTKTVVCNYSSKKWWDGHRLRFQLCENLKTYNDFKFIDFQGPLHHTEYLPKLETLKDYHYAIQIENQKVDDFFSDKIIDSFLTGTIPIYRGTNNIVKYFDKRGIITFDTEDELHSILRDLNTDYYYQNLEAIKNNFEEAKKYVSPDDWILNNYRDTVFI